MNETALRYRIYTVLLESDITQTQREVLNEAFLSEGWLDNLKSWAGAVKDTGALDVGKIFADNKFKRRVKVAGDNISKEIDGLKSVAKSAGVDEETVLSMLSAILKGSGASPSELSSAERSTTGSGGSASSVGSSGGSAAPAAGSPITPDKMADNPSLASRLLAAITGKSKEETEKVVANKKPNAVTLIKTVSDSISKSSGVDPKKTAKIVKVLMDTGHVVVEGRSLRHVRPLSNTNDIVLERWQSLAGLKLLNEDRYADNLTKVIKSGQLKSADDLTKHLEDEIANLGDEGEGAIEDIEKNKAKIIKDAGRGGTKDRAALDSAIDAAKKKVAKPSAAEDEAPAGKPEEKPEEKPASEATKEESGFDLEATKKEFASAFKEVRSKLDEKEISDEELAKVMKALDLKDEIEVK